MDYLAESASDLRVERAFGIQSEMVLAFAGVHQLCGSMLDQIGKLTDPQRNALETALGISSGPTPDRFLVSLAVLNLLSAVAEERPVLGLIDDAQWLDWVSKQVLTFVARRLLAESIGLVFAVRNPPDEFSGLPQREVGRLSDGDARALLAQVMPGRLDPGVRDRIVAETRGNPLAILELSHELTVADLGGGFAAPEPGSLAKRIEETYGNRILHLPPDTNRLLLAAAAEPVGDPTLLWGAAELMNLDPEAAAPAISAGLLDVGARVRFPHPLMRSAVYGAASVPARHTVHRALADTIDAKVDPDLRAWHLAQAVSGYDEDVALELERSADRAQARGGVAAAAAFLERSAALTRDSVLRTHRMLGAAQAMIQAGAFEQAARLLADAEAGHLDELSRARIDLLRAKIAAIQNRGRDALPLLLAAARRLEQFDVLSARDTYLDAVASARYAGVLVDTADLKELGEGARRVAGVAQPGVASTLLNAFAMRLTEGYVASTPMMKRVLATLTHEGTAEAKERRWLWLGSIIAVDLLDAGSWHLVAARQVALTREIGALSELPTALDLLAFFHLFAGDFGTAALLFDEVNIVCDAMGISPAPIGRVCLAAWQGHEAEARNLTGDMISQAVQLGQGSPAKVARVHEAILFNGLGKYEEALIAAEEAVRHDSFSPRFGIEELIEAAVRCGKPELAADAVERLSETTQASGTDWALGVEARTRALLAEGDAAEQLYREAIERLARTRIRTDLARAQLLYGEWLRREGRRVDAREQLRAAYEAFSGFGAEAFAERSRRELVATGETARRRTVETTFELTTQEALIARLAAEGYTNPEIGTQLFLSPRTVEYHLHKVFTKMGVTSRRELRPALQQSQ
jgi:DNA-binding CsgD family transcriptional regulator